MTNLDYLKAKACEAIGNHASELYSVSQQIWSNPELFYEEKFAHKLLTDYLNEKGFQVTKNYHLDTAFSATYGQKDKPHIALMCEYDALPDIGHGCGHNLIAEAGVAAGLGIHAAMQAADTDLGKLTVLGTPAEEGGGGKVELIRAGVFDDFDVAMMVHPGSFSAGKTDILAMTEVTVTYKGRASHSAASPWEGKNALDAAVLAYNNISCLRQQMKPEWRVHGIITNGGEKTYIIPEKSELLFYLRTPTKLDLQQLKKKAQACFEAAAQSTGCQVEIDWEKNPYDNMVANSEVVKLYEKNVRSLGEEFCMDQTLLRMPTGSTDMGNVSHVVPAIHPHFYMGTTEPAHSAAFRIAAGSPTAQFHTLIQGKALAMTALDIFSCTDILEKIKSRFLADMAEQRCGANS